MRATVDCKSTDDVKSAAAEVRTAKSEGTGLSGVALDCPVPQEDKALMVARTPKPNGWVTWRRTGQPTVHVWWRTGQPTVPIWWRTGLSGAPIASSFPNGYFGD
jgi:hypothetical protein